MTQGLDGSENKKSIVKGHYAKCRKTFNEVWGLATCNDDEHYVSVGDDATIRVWSSKERKMKFSKRLDIDINGVILPPDRKTGELTDGAKLRSVDVNPNNNMIAVGCFDGTVRVSS